jgi:hypothetical protein
MSKLSDAALDYLERGLSIIALEGKAPHVQLHPRGINDPITGAPETEEERAAVIRHFTTDGVTGIGISTGGPYFVVDIDGEEGAVAWRDLAKADYLPSRWVAKTGRGLHLWFGSPTGPVVSRKLGSKLDLKGVGGYVVAPPSAHPDGGSYEWLVGPMDGPPLEAPEALQAHLAKLTRADERAAELRVQHRPVRHQPIERSELGFRFFPSWGFEGVIDRMVKAEEGNRHGLFFWAARTMLEQWATSDEIEALTQAGLEAGLESRYMRRTIRAARAAQDG